MSSSPKPSLLNDCEFLLRAIQGIVWEADPKTMKFSCVSEQAETILGFSGGRMADGQFLAGPCSSRGSGCRYESVRARNRSGTEF